MSSNELQREAFVMGRKAHKQGIKAVAVLDSRLMQIIRNHHTHTTVMLRAWHRGWHRGGHRASGVGIEP